MYQPVTSCVGVGGMPKDLTTSQRIDLRISGSDSMTPSLCPVCLPVKVDSVFTGCVPSDRSDEDFPWGLGDRSIHFLWVGLLFCKNNLYDS